MKKIMIFLWVVLALVLIALGSTYFLLPGFVDKKIKEKIAALRAEGVEIEYDSLRAEVWSNRVTVDSLVIRLPEKDVTIRMRSLQLRRFKVFAFLLRREIHFGKLVLDRPALTLLKQKQADSVQTRPKAKPVALFIDSVRLNHLTVVQWDSAGADTLRAGLDLRILNLAYNNALPEPFEFSIVSASNVGVQFELYDLRVDRLYMDKTLKRLEVDSLKLKPRYSKRDFAARTKVETDRFDAVVPSIRMQDFEAVRGDSAYVAATRVDARFTLFVYRNKHYPFPDRDYMPLPVDALKRMPFGLRIDTLRVADSFVSYEEVGEKADSSGTLFFKDLNAALYGINSDSAAGAPMLHASAQLMGQGRLELQCDFSKTRKPARLKGSLQNFPLALLNDVLRPQAAIAITSGTILRLNFRFTFDDVRSQGTTDLSYKNLKVMGLREDKETEKAVKNELLTLAMNIFIKDDAGRYVAGERLNGTIAFERDRRKAIFNFWWKSLFTGIKSSFNIPSDANKNGAKQKEKNGKGKKDRRKKSSS